MFGIHWWQRITRALIAFLTIAVVALILAGCGVGLRAQQPGNSQAISGKANPSTRNITEVSPPEVIQQLRQALANYQPQVAILNPRPDEVIQDNKLQVKLQIRDLPTFKSQELDLGPYLQVILDNRPFAAVHDTNKLLDLSDLEPGTHTLRVFAAQPWHESFKNAGAYAQTTFHIFTKTQDNNPDPTQPLLTYSRPQNSYGAEPILLDFYLNNAPRHLVAPEASKDTIPSWHIRCTINGSSFIMDRWEAVYLQGFKPGKNWVQLELLDEQDNPIKNVFNSTTRVITYEPKGEDTLSQLVRGELSADEARGIVDRNYTPKIPAVTPSPTPTPSLTPSPTPTPISPSKVVESPSPEESAVHNKTVPQLENTEKPQPLVIPKTEDFHPPLEQPKSGNFFSRYRRPAVKPSPILPSTPKTTNPPTSVLESDAPQSKELVKPSIEPTEPAEKPMVEDLNEAVPEPDAPKPDVKEILLP